MSRKQERCDHKPQRKTDLKNATMAVTCSSCGFVFGKVPLTPATVGYGASVMKDNRIDPKAFAHVWMENPPWTGSPVMNWMLSLIDPWEIVTGQKRVQVDVICGSEIMVSAVKPES